MELSAIQDLLSHYQKAGNNTNLSLKYFETLLVFFPCLLVVASDGVVDQEEMVYVQYLSKFMAESYKHQIDEPSMMALQQGYYKELTFLLDNLRDWREPFLNTLDKYLAAYPEMKDTVLDTIHLFADASEGTSSSEEAAIALLIERLKLEE